MFRKMIYLVPFVLVLGLATSAEADLVARYTFDDGTFNDSAGTHHGTGNGDAQVVNDPERGMVLVLDGDGDFVELPPAGGEVMTLTWAMWVKVDQSSDQSTLISGWYYKLLTNSVDSVIGSWVPGLLAFLIEDGGRLRGHAAQEDPLSGATVLQAGTWYHLAVVRDGTNMILYVDGQEDGRQAILSNRTIDFSTGFYIGTWKTNFFRGRIDDVQIYDSVLTESEIQQVMIGKEKGTASNPIPADGATDVPREVTLNWMPGEFANTHDVYLGTVFEYVNDADRSDQRGVLASQGQIAATYDPGRLDFGQTYFWRVDEVNAPPDYTIFKGDVWSFTVEPFAYPIESITATASSAIKAGEGPENTVNGSGLDDDDLHSSDSDDMWLSNFVDPDRAWIQYEFDRVHKLYRMWVWNYNSSVEPMVGFGVKEATIEYSLDGTNWAIFGTTHEFARGPGAAGYAHNTTVDLGGAAAKYVRITANSNWGGMVNQYGLSEVRFLYIPVWATEPSPDSGATDVDVDTILSFRAGREAAKHDVYISTDEQTVIDGTVPVAGVTEASYAPSLDLAGTYYWRIDEVNDAEIPTTWQGDIWNLSTQEYLVVEDFESYNDIPAGEEGSNLVYGTWVDGFENPANGSTIGYNEPFQPTIETSLVYDGKKSVPLFYDNTVAAYSEVTANVADLDVGRDWTMHGIKALTLRFRGDPNNNVQQMYVKINGSKVTYDGDAENLKRTGWQMWYIDLTSIGVNLSNVTELAIGFERIGAVGGQGMVLLDGIRLYSYDRQLITPVESGATGLQAHYEFEGNTNDSSGNARHGAAMGSPTFVAGKVGQAINLRGLNDYVEITGYKGILGSSAVTVTAWVKTVSTDTGAIVGWGPNVAGERFGFRLDVGRLRLEHQGGNVQGDTLVIDGAWHHVAVTVQENATISYPDVILYLDGMDDTRRTTDPDAFNLTAGEDVRIGSRPSNNDRFFLGQIDEVRIYNRALSKEEIAWLGGRIAPFDKTF